MSPRRRGRGDEVNHSKDPDASRTPPDGCRAGGSGRRVGLGRTGAGRRAGREAVRRNGRRIGAGAGARPGKGWEPRRRRGRMERYGTGSGTGRGRRDSNQRGDSVSESAPGRAESGRITGQDEVVDLCSELIRIDTSNYGDHSGPGERAAAEYVAEKLAEVGLEPRDLRVAPGPGLDRGQDRGRGPQPARAAHPRAPRRRARPTPTTGPATPSPARSPTAACGAAARST